MLDRFVTFRTVYRRSWRSILSYTIHTDRKLPFKDVLWVIRGR